MGLVFFPAPVPLYKPVVKYSEDQQKGIWFGDHATGWEPAPEEYYIVPPWDYPDWSINNGWGVPVNDVIIDY